MRRGKSKRERMERGVRIEVWIKSRRGGDEKDSCWNSSHIYNEQMREKKRESTDILTQMEVGFLMIDILQRNQRETFVQDKISSLRLHTDSKFGCSCVAGLWLTFGPYCNLIWPRAAHLYRKRLSGHLMWTSQEKNKPMIFFFMRVNLKCMEACFHLRGGHFFSLRALYFSLLLFYHTSVVILIFMT